MSDRERVIRGLECCGAKEHCHYGEDGCPFYFPENPDDCTSRLARQALALLKEQEPRVLTLDELRALPVGAVVWYEQRALLQTYIMPMIVTEDNHIGNWALGVCMDVIGQDDRCWSAKPTDEQREATPWRT